MYQDFSQLILKRISLNSPFFNPFAAKDEYTRLWQGIPHCQDEYTRPTLNRVATQPGKPGEPGKVRELDISPKNQGKVREFRRFY